MRLESTNLSNNPYFFGYNWLVLILGDWFMFDEVYGEALNLYIVSELYQKAESEQGFLMF